MVIAFCADFCGRWKGAVVDGWVEVEVEESEDCREEEDAEECERMRERGHHTIASERFRDVRGGKVVYICSNNNVMRRRAWRWGGLACFKGSLWPSGR